jgi:hypothetical protein
MRQQHKEGDAGAGAGAKQDGGADDMGEQVSWPLRGSIPVAAR